MNSPEFSRSSGAHRFVVRAVFLVCLGVFVTLPATVSVEAGLILRGGGGSGASAQGGVYGTNAAAQAKAAANAKQVLAQTAQALKNVQDLQNAARTLSGGNNLGKDPNHLGSQLPDVPDGLAIGGLVPDSGLKAKGVANQVTWAGAGTPTQDPTTPASTDKVTVTIVQTAQQALLNWKTFNIGKNTTLFFDQSAAKGNYNTWIALNKINDPSGSPTQILGSIKAPGQVYVINQNGIIFGKNCQVNLHALVASSLPINDNLVQGGLLNNQDQQFLFSELPLAAGAHSDAFTPAAPNTPDGKCGDVVVQAGASISSPISSVVTDPSFQSQGKSTYETAQQTAGKDVWVTYGTAQTSLTPNTDYTVSQSADGKTIVNFTTDGSQKINQDPTTPVTVSYTVSNPASTANTGGRIALIGPNVSNAGTISTPNGQTILAAGLQVGIHSHPGADPSLRGIDVYVGQVDANSGIATNVGADANGVATNSIADSTQPLGLIEAPRGNVTIAGKCVNQLGFIDCTTSVSLNGRIDLLADYNATSNPAYDTVLHPQPYLFQSAGTVTMGVNSVTRILPELSSDARVVGSYLALPSLINIQGQAIHMAANSVILAPGASLPDASLTNRTIPVDGSGSQLLSGVSFNTGIWESISEGTQFVNGWSASTQQGYGQIYLDANAIIDVAGSTDVAASVSENILSVKLLGPELANYALQRNGALRGQTIQVDIGQSGVYNGQTWVGTPLADLSGWAALIQRTVGELTTNGGTVSLTGGNSVVMGAGSRIDVSGGWIDYQGANVQTSRVLSDGHSIDIAQATPDRVYDGFDTGFAVTSSKWGVGGSYTSSLMSSGNHYEDGYTQGGNGGTISVQAPAMALDGGLLGNTVAGARQRTVAPNPSSLVLAFNASSLDDSSFVALSPWSPSVVFKPDSTLPSVAPFSDAASLKPLPVARLNEVDLSPDLTSQDGFGNLTVNNGDGNISVPDNVTLKTQAGGKIVMTGANIDIEGSVAAAGGNLSFTVYDFSPYTYDLYLRNPKQHHTPPLNSSRGNFTLGATASLSAAGLIVDDRGGSLAPYSQPLVTNGGSITINSYNADLHVGSVIDVSGGVAMSVASQLSYGNAGAISISAGQDPKCLSLVGGSLELGATLEGYAGGKGGALTIQAPLIQIGGGTLMNGDPSNATMVQQGSGVWGNGNTLWLDRSGSPDFFNQGGFVSFVLNAIGAATNQALDQYLPAIDIAPDTVISPAVQSWLAVPDAQSIGLQTTLLPNGLRGTAASLKFKAMGLTDSFGAQDLLVRGDLLMGQGATIKTDPQADGKGNYSTGQVTLGGNTVAVLGSVIAPGGGITVSGGGRFATINALNAARTTVDLGPDSVFSTAGVALYIPDPTGHGYRTGSILNGGSITVSGDIVAETGARIDVSGASGNVDLLAAYSTLSTPVSSLMAAPVVSVRVDSNGGAVTLAGSEELFTDATLIGAAGGPTALGGSLTVSSGRFIGVNDSNPVTTPLDPTLLVTQSGPIFAGSIYPIGRTAIGLALPSLSDANGKPVYSHLAVDSFNGGGFGALNLRGTIQFVGQVSIDATRSLAVADGGVLYANDKVTLTAPYVALGMPFQAPVAANQQADPFLDSASQTVNISPTWGTGSLTVIASLIDLGNLSLQKIGSVDLTAKNGDIRGDGIFDVKGAVTMTAGQIYPTTAVSFTIAAYDDISTDGLNTILHPGSVTIIGSGVRPLPMSGGGRLSIYAPTINQGGTLRAPLGIVNLGCLTDSAPIDVMTSHAFQATQTLTLQAGSVTSVSAIDPTTHQALTIPYGINVNGTQWIDPTGNNIFTDGVPTKLVNIAAMTVKDNAGALIDISGGGDLYAYRWVAGVTGTKDILNSSYDLKNSSYDLTNSSSSFAIIPGYNFAYAPYAPFNANSNFVYQDPSSGKSFTDTGYTSNGLAVGSQIHLGASNGLPAGTYTLLPARYALLPGAFLVTPKSGTPAGTVSNPDGSSMVSGYLTNAFASQTGNFASSNFEVDPAAVVRARAEYDNYSGNTYLSTSAVSQNIAIPRLPFDAGQLVLSAYNSILIQGSVSSQAVAGKLGGLVDISSPLDILIDGPNTDLTGVTDTLVLNSSDLSAFGAASLLIGGVRQTGGYTINLTANDNRAVLIPSAGGRVTLPNGTPGNDTIVSTVNGKIVDPTGVTSDLTANSPTTVKPNSTITFSKSDVADCVNSNQVPSIKFSGGTGGAIAVAVPVNGTGVTVSTGNVTVDNAGAALTGPDVILVANNRLTVASKSVIQSAGVASNQVGTVWLGGAGASLRVSNDSTAQVVRSGVNSSTIPTMDIGAAAQLSGASVTLDSSYATRLDPTAILKGDSITLNSGQISLELANPGAIQPTAGLVLSNQALQTLQAGTKALSLLSYSSIDIYGNGVIGSSSFASMALHASEIRGFNAVDGATPAVTFKAQKIVLDNAPDGNEPGAVPPAAGTLEFDAETIQLGANQLCVDQYATLNLNASNLVSLQGLGALATANALNGRTTADAVKNLVAQGALIGLTTQGDLTITTPLITGATAANQTILAGGALKIVAPASTANTSLVGGLGASLTLIGSSVSDNSNITLPSGALTLYATGGDLSAGSGCILNVAGTVRHLYNLDQFSSGGNISLISDNGAVTLTPGSKLTVAVADKNQALGDAGSISVVSGDPAKTFSMTGVVLSGFGSVGGKNGTFSLDAGGLPSMAALNSSLNDAMFTESRSIRVRTGNVAVDGLAMAHSFSLSADDGSITVSNTIDASGATGGSIHLYSYNGVTLSSGADLTVEAMNGFDAAGKGGLVDIETDGAKLVGGVMTVGNGWIDIQNHSTINLTVNAPQLGLDGKPVVVNGKTVMVAVPGGTLHLRAPQIVSNVSGTPIAPNIGAPTGSPPAGTDLAIRTINGVIKNPASIVAEGFWVQDAAATGGASIDDYVAAANTNAAKFTDHWSTIQDRLLTGTPNASLIGTGVTTDVFQVRPGEEIDNSKGNLTLNNDLNLANYRYGVNADTSSYTGAGQPGVLTLRAKGNLIFNGALTDGFGNQFDPTLGVNALWEAYLLSPGSQSWSYRLTAGADFGASDFHQVMALANIGPDSGSLMLGVYDSQPYSNNGGSYSPENDGSYAAPLTSSVLVGYYQVIRTGVGDIDISTGRDVRLLNQFATIYTAGVQVADATLGGKFDTPLLYSDSLRYLPLYPAQYSFGGGNVTIRAQGNIEHVIQDGSLNSDGSLKQTPDSEMQLPSNWLYRRGYVNSSNSFGTLYDFGSLFGDPADVASTSWWVDFSNFFEGVGALGGGNVTMIAGHNITNVDAVIPTNARVTKQTSTGDTLAADQTLTELGGGNLVVSAGQNIDGGAYYVERGKGTLSAGNQITTNSTRSPSVPRTVLSNVTVDPSQSPTWLPTTLFLGKGSFDVSAGGDLLMGPVANVFLMPQGASNSYWYKTYFSTYASTDAVNVSSLTGAVTFRESATLSQDTTATPLLLDWYKNVDLYVPTGSVSVSFYQPWLISAETVVDAFTTVVKLLPSTLRATAFSSDINIVGDLTLTPSPTGTIDLAAAGSINGLQANGVSASGNLSAHPPVNVWGTGLINLSDADPSKIPGVTSPSAYQTLVSTLDQGTVSVSGNGFLYQTDALFAESGATQGNTVVLSTQQALHDSSVLHAGDTQPIHLYAGTGDISGLTLFSAKAARVVAGNDITDIALYIQNDNTNDFSVVSAGRDIIAYDPQALLRKAATATGNALDGTEYNSIKKTTIIPDSLAGDIQISGPGTLEVLAGRNLNLAGPTNPTPDGTAVGISSVGNERNPFLPFDGASVIAGAGIGGSFGLDDLNSRFDFSSFVSQFMGSGSPYLQELGTTTVLPGGAFDQWSPEERDLVAREALDVFYLVLRDAGKEHNTPGTPGYKNYNAGFSAIKALFPGNQWSGDIDLTSREIKTASGGDISLFAPGGQLTVGVNQGNQPSDQGILTGYGGNISIFTNDSVIVGTSRIFTLRGGNVVIWSSAGNIAAGAASRTVQSAPPTRVLIDVQSADVKTDLAGIATGGGIGVLETVTGASSGDATLVAPMGSIDAGDAGIRVSGNLNISANVVLNAGNIQVGGASAGTPAAVSAPSVVGVTAAPSASVATNSASLEQAAAQRQQSMAQDDIPSIISVEVIGYGGGDSSDDDSGAN